MRGLNPASSLPPPSWQLREAELEAWPRSPAIQAYPPGGCHSSPFVPIHPLGISPCVPIFLVHPWRETADSSQSSQHLGNEHQYFRFDPHRLCSLPPKTSNAATRKLPAAATLKYYSKEKANCQEKNCWARRVSSLLRDVVHRLARAAFQGSFSHRKG